ncbi:MAG: sel1 repeat family protein [Deltaproteobacteria bacterium]|nr:sel1 repeat family protein [Deltaproteobacteria bacterium]
MHNRMRPKMIAIAAAVVAVGALVGIACPPASDHAPSAQSSPAPAPATQTKPAQPKPLTLDDCLNRPASRACEAVALERLLAGDAETSADLFTRMCDADEVRGCYGLGNAYAAGIGVNQSNRRARAAFRKGCDGDDGASCYRLATLSLAGSDASGPSNRSRRKRHKHRPSHRLRGAGAEPEFGASTHASTRASTHASASVASVVASASASASASAHSDFGNRIRAGTKEHALLERACTLGHAPACRFLGGETGFERGCALGDAVACLLLGLARQEQKRPPAGAFRSGCALGEGESCFWNARASEEEDQEAGTITHPTVVAYYDRRACELGFAAGCQRIGEAHFAGSGVPKDTARALEWWNDACRKGLGESCWRLGDVFEHGKEVNIDLQYAQQIYRHACALGSTQGCADASRLESDPAPTDADAAPEDD